MTRFTIRGFAIAAAVALLSSAALAADPAPGAAPADPTPAQRQTMAEIHTKMASCLASERPFAECRAEMQQGCITMMGANGCPMMGMMGGGMHRRGMMGGPNPPPAPPVEK